MWARACSKSARRRATATSAATNPKAPPPTDEQVPPTAVQNDQLVSLTAQARRLAADGKFDEAEAALEKADKVYAGWSETEKARSDIAEMRTPEAQLKMQLDRARLAIEHDDRATAEKALAEAERLNAQAPQIAELRRGLHLFRIDVYDVGNAIDYNTEITAAR